MAAFRKMQSVALWFHIPLWILAAIAVVLMGAYNAGAQQYIREEAETAQTVKLLLYVPVDGLSKIDMGSI